MWKLYSTRCQSVMLRYWVTCKKRHCKVNVALSLYNAFICLRRKAGISPVNAVPAWSAAWTTETLSITNIVAKKDYACICVWQVWPSNRMQNIFVLIVVTGEIHSMLCVAKVLLLLVLNSQANTSRTEKVILQYMLWRLALGKVGKDLDCVCLRSRTKRRRISSRYRREEAKNRTYLNVGECIRESHSVQYKVLYT